MGYTVYVLKCADGTLYTGITNDLEGRVAAHNNGVGAKYTRGRIPVVLVYNENCAGRSDALKREQKIKRMTREKKLQMIEVK